MFQRQNSQNTDFKYKITVIPLYQNDGYSLEEDEGFNLHFLPSGEKIKVLRRSSRKRQN